MTTPLPATSVPVVPSLAPFAERMLAALRLLTKESSAHPCGGFTTDDMQWRMGVAFTDSETLWGALDELERSGLILFAGEDETYENGVCYALNRPTTMPARG